MDSDEDVRRALVAAARSLQERALINRGMAQRIDVMPLYAQRYLREAEDAERQAAILDRLLERLMRAMDDTAPKHRRAG